MQAPPFVILSLPTSSRSLELDKEGATQALVRHSCCTCRLSCPDEEVRGQDAKFGQPPFPPLPFPLSLGRPGAPPHTVTWERRPSPTPAENRVWSRVCRNRTTRESQNLSCPPAHSVLEAHTAASLTHVLCTWACVLQCNGVATLKFFTVEYFILQLTFSMRSLMENGARCEQSRPAQCGLTANGPEAPGAQGSRGASSAGAQPAREDKVARGLSRWVGEGTDSSRRPRCAQTQN